MKNILLTLIFLIIVNFVFSQKIDNNYLTTTNQSVYSPNFEKAEASFDVFYENNNIDIISINKTKTSIFAKFYLKKELKTEYDSLVATIGYSNSKDEKTTSYSNQIVEKTNEIEYLKLRKSEYNKEIELKKLKNETYEVLWNEVMNIDAQIHNYEKQLTNLKVNSNYLITLRIHDDNIDLTSRRVNWINMPGGSYDVLWVENPTLGLSMPMYQGGSLKYMFTRGKSYAKLGVLKGVKSNNDTLPNYSELFQFSFGQDYYTKHFGRGKRQFFNLYSGYDVGGIFATGKDINGKFLPFIKVHLGIELFKNKYILIDNKISYFVPFVDNRGFRGLAYSASFNFVF